MTLTPALKQIAPLKRRCPYCGEERVCRLFRQHLEHCSKAPVRNVVEMQRLLSEQPRRVCPYCHAERPVGVFVSHVTNCLKNPRRPET